MFATSMCLWGCAGRSYPSHSTSRSPAYGGSGHGLFATAGEPASCMFLMPCMRDLCHAYEIHASRTQRQACVWSAASGGLCVRNRAICLRFQPRNGFRLHERCGRPEGVRRCGPRRIAERTTEGRVGIARLVRSKEYQATCIRSYLSHYGSMLVGAGLKLASTHFL